jgi:hypothetical protein
MMEHDVSIDERSRNTLRSYFFADVKVLGYRCLLVANREHIRELDELV